MTARTDWPFGPELRRRREGKGLSVRKAARLTQGRISEGRWRQLEEGVHRVQGQTFPINTRPATAAAAANVVGWDVDDALRMLGLDPADYGPEEERESASAVLKFISDEDLVLEVSQRLARARLALKQQAVEEVDQSADGSERSTGSTILDAFSPGDAGERRA